MEIKKERQLGVIMILEDKWSWKRFFVLFIMTAATAAMSAFIVLMHRTARDSWLILALCGTIFSVLLALNLEENRREQGIFHEKSNNFVRIGMAYVMCCILTAAVSFLPDYARPVMLVPVIMTMVSAPFPGFLAGCYCSVVLTFAGSGSVALMACYLFLCVCGCTVVRYLKEPRNLFWGSFMILTVTFCMTSLFSTLAGTAFSPKTLAYGIGNGIMTSVIAALLFWLWNDKIETSKEDLLEKIIKEPYTLVQTMNSYSEADYEHARKVSRIAGDCAGRIGADEKLSAAAGFYYRVGRLEGEPFVENGIELAKRHNFPPELIQILGEYNGEKYLPSTVESALVHIVDNVVAKFDVLDRATLSSSWNQDIVVYQTLNENSAKGLYDKSGLSMNMFLIIRDYLIKEASLYDSDH